MPRYIDADELLKEMRHYACRPTKSALYLIEERAEHPADVVEVVRCKDCKWAVPYQMINGSVRLHCNESDLTGISPDDYCSFGKRKEKTDETN